MPEYLTGEVGLQPTTVTMFDLALTARQRLERAWDDQTAFQGLEVQPEDPPSRGQCGVSSLWFSRELCRQGYGARWVEGDILLGGDAKEGHCWVEVPVAEGKTIIIDVTSDQYRTVFGTSVHVGYAEMAEGPARYVKKEEFNPFAVPHRKLSARCDILTQRMERQKLKGKMGALLRSVIRKN